MGEIIIEFAFKFSALLCLIALMLMTFNLSIDVFCKESVKNSLLANKIQGVVYVLAFLSMVLMMLGVVGIMFN